MYCYLVLAENGLTKIGKTKNFYQRFLGIKSTMPVRCELLHIFEYDESKIDLEKELHNKYANKRVKGEWFILSRKELLNLVDNPDKQEIIKLIPDSFFEKGLSEAKKKNEPFLSFLGNSCPDCLTDKQLMILSIIYKFNNRCSFEDLIRTINYIELPHLVVGKYPKPDMIKNYGKQSIGKTLKFLIAKNYIKFTGIYSLTEKGISCGKGKYNDIDKVITDALNTAINREKEMEILMKEGSSLSIIGYSKF